MEATAEATTAKDGKKSMKADAAADSDSPLSELAKTPEPPSSLLQAMAAPKPLNHCGSCKSWCTCPKGVTYPNPSPEHLSVSALEKAQDGMPVSAMRSTVQTPFPGESIYPTAHVQKQCTDGAELLCEIQPPVQGGMTKTRVSQFKRALKFMQDVLACFPPKEDLPGTVSAIEKVLKALEQWKQEGSYEGLWDAIDGAVNGSPDLLLDLQGFLPEDRRTTGMSELWKTRVERLVFEKKAAAKK